MEQKIIIAVEAKDTRLALLDTLKKSMGYTNIFDTENALDALAEIEKQGMPSLIIADLETPSKMTGADLFRHARDFSYMGPFVLAASDLGETARQTQDILFAPILVGKPYNHELLRATIKQAMAQGMEASSAPKPEEEFYP